MNPAPNDPASSDALNPLTRPPSSLPQLSPRGARVVPLIPIESLDKKKKKPKSSSRKKRRRGSNSSVTSTSDYSDDQAHTSDEPLSGNSTDWRQNDNEYITPQQDSGLIIKTMLSQDNDEQNQNFFTNNEDQPGM